MEPQWALWVVLGMLAIFIISETVGPKLKEGFAVPIRSDVASATTEESGFARDPRYAAQFADVQNNGIAGDFCRAVSRRNQPDSLQIACALATRVGMNTVEYTSPTVKQGFRMCRDDYWRDVNEDGRMDYCRILKDEGTGEWSPMCAVTTATGIGPREVRDTSPPPAIQDLLEAYTDIVTWFRFRDDTEDYAKNTVIAVNGRPTIPQLIAPTVTSGVQFNRGAPSKGPFPDFLRWGEKGTMQLDQEVKPSEIRAISFWVYWDSFEPDARIFESHNGDGAGQSKKDLAWFGIDPYAGVKELPAMKPPRVAYPAAELPAAEVYALGPPRVEPMRPVDSALPLNPMEELQNQASYVFELWDDRQRVIRLIAPQAAKAKKWQHIAITTTEKSSWWCVWQIWVDGVLAIESGESRGISALYLKNNILGKNFRGCLQDFRVYRAPIPASKIRSAMKWSSKLLNHTP